MQEKKKEKVRNSKKSNYVQKFSTDFNNDHKMKFFMSEKINLTNIMI